MEAHTAMDSPECLVLSHQTLLVLCGIAGAGKSTFARAFVAQHSAHGLRETSIVASDHCRALICDSDNNQNVSGDAFELLYYLLDKRMRLRRFTIVDSTALQAPTRQKLLAQARQHQYRTCLLVFNTSAALCIQRDGARNRIVGEEVIAYQENLLRQTLQAIPHEGWHQFYVFAEHAPLLTFV